MSDCSTRQADVPPSRLLKRSVASSDLHGLGSRLTLKESLSPGQFLLAEIGSLTDSQESLRAGTGKPTVNNWLGALPEDGAYEMGGEETVASVAPVPVQPQLPPPPQQQRRGRPLGNVAERVVRAVQIRPRKLMAIFCAFLVVYVVNMLFAGLYLHSPAAPPPYLTSLASYNASVLPNAAFQPPEGIPYRLPDTLDTFAGYKYRGACNISSLDLHAPFSPLCTDRQSMLTAMASGGRIGMDAPFMPRGCDMRWFTTEEACEILSRFQKVIFVGDSMMRHVIGSLNVLIRKDLGYGAVTDWNFSPQERRDCFCNYQFNVKSCSIQGIFKTADVIQHDPESLACPAGSLDVMIEVIIRFPIPQEELDRFKAAIGTTKPAKPYAFVFGHGLWNDLDLQATVDWLDLLLDTTTSQLPYLSEPNAFWPRLFVTPNAAGIEKPDEWLVTQGDKALMTFEDSVKSEAGRRGVEHLGTWNMSVQSNKYDGVHLDLRGNLIKAMMVLNWLNLLEVEKH